MYKVLCFWYLFHGQNLACLLLLHLPHTSKSSWTHLVQKFVVVTGLLFHLNYLTIKRCWNIRVVAAYETSLVTILFDRFFCRFWLGGGYSCLVGLEEIIGLRTSQNCSSFGYKHIECELEIDFIAFLVDFEEEIGSWTCFLLLFLHLFDHFLSKTLNSKI